MKADPWLSGDELGVFAVGLFLGIIFGACVTMLLQFYADRDRLRAEREREGSEDEPES